jgi:peptidylprolyl isomerase
MQISIFAMLMACSIMATGCTGNDTEKETIVTLETTAGTIRMKLYNDTPGHRDNFIKNVNEGLYDGVTFHRVIRNFMIQTGDPFTRPGEVADTTKKDPTIPAEIVYPTHFHKRGAIGAARDGDDENPGKESNKFQFYIVTGKHYSDARLSELEGIAYQKQVERIYDEKTKAYTERLDAMRRQRNR